MNERVERAVQDFVINLTGTDCSEIQRYSSEIISNAEFHSQLEDNEARHRRRGLSSWGWGIGTTLGIVLYTICRILRPDTVVETGVASGVSSSYILCALEQNKHGALHSIDLSWRNGQSGWIIPGYLRHRWQLISGRSSDTLSPLLEELGAVDVFLHDSEHSYKNMLWEYHTAWAYLGTGGLLLSHNIDSNDAFSDFCRSVKYEGYILSNLGGVVKV
jgi:predicted O-methyltransferase YrrM